MRLSFFAVLCLLFSFASCNENDDNNTPSIVLNASLSSCVDNNVVIDCSCVLSKSMMEKYICRCDGGVCFSRSNPLPTRKDSFLCAFHSDIEKSPQNFSVTAKDLYFGGQYHFRAYIILDNDIYYSEPSSFTIQQPIDSEYVDLGLSVKWATKNLGAKDANEYGNIYAWGETEPSNVEVKKDYKYYDGDISKVLKYCNDEIFGTTDNLTVIEPVDDAAVALLGQDWRMPTKEEWQELLTKCKWERSSFTHNCFKTSSNEVNKIGITINDDGFEFSVTPTNEVILDYTDGIRVTGKNGNSIYLPCPDPRVDPNISIMNLELCYWTSSLSEDSRFATCCNVERKEAYGLRRNACAKVRPVYCK